MSIRVEMILRLLLAAAPGVITGFQRERAGKQAGLRTIIPVRAEAGMDMVSAVASILIRSVLLLPHPIR